MSYKKINLVYSNWKEQQQQSPRRPLAFCKTSTKTLNSKPKLSIYKTLNWKVKNVQLLLFYFRRSNKSHLLCPLYVIFYIVSCFLFLFKTFFVYHLLYLHLFHHLQHLLFQPSPKLQRTNFRVAVPPKWLLPAGIPLWGPLHQIPGPSPGPPCRSHWPRVHCCRSSSLLATDDNSQLPSQARLAVRLNNPILIQSFKYILNFQQTFLPQPSPTTSLCGYSLENFSKWKFIRRRR